MPCITCRLRNVNQQKTSPEAYSRRRQYIAQFLLLAIEEALKKSSLAVVSSRSEPEVMLVLAVDTRGHLPLWNTRQI